MYTLNLYLCTLKLKCWYMKVSWWGSTNKLLFQLCLNNFNDETIPTEERSSSCVLCKVTCFGSSGVAFWNLPELI